MKMITFSILLVVAVLVISGCSSAVVRTAGQLTKEKRTVKGFNKVALTGSGGLILIQGDTESLEVEAPENLLPYIETEVRSGTLYLGLRPGVSWTVFITKPIRYYLTAKDISALEVNGSGEITTDLLETTALDLRVQGSGSIRIDELDAASLENEIEGSGDISIGALNADKVSTHIIGSGSCSLEGQAAEQTVRIGGSGDYRAYEMESETVSANIGGSGSVDVWVTESLDVSIAGSGNVSYYGSPEVSYTVMGSGEIDKAGDR